MRQPLRLCVLISGNGSNLQAIIDAIEKGTLSAEVTGVISNNPDAVGLVRASRHGIPSWVINHQDFNEREAFDQALQHRIRETQSDFIVLAGFMRILDSAFIQAFSDRILNIHPSLLPKYKGLNTFQRAMENGDSRHGVSIHLVTTELDGGPLLMQESYPILANDSIDSLQERGHKLEHQMYPALLQLLASQQLVISDDGISFNGNPLSKPLELHDVVDI